MTNAFPIGGYGVVQDFMNHLKTTKLFYIYNGKYLDHYVSDHGRKNIDYNKVTWKDLHITSKNVKEAGPYRKSYQQTTPVLDLQP